ncbi:aminoglycoside phosphotransferase family protein [Pseudomonas sp. LSJ-87]|uniref:phosphotransferase family protein n=1 Tax=Pseudomonas sp. LSJ-87 TaxID=3079932 RepID=UPI00293F7F5A|nr:aminoglycoside phosphotransferase family protein [Pseudomonas sp. LSJ-87]MDV5098425.1 aminoglycoside phosphotransferase family protein [Pseudomonas sp. LSJ-87]
MRRVKRGVENFALDYAAKNIVENILKSRAISSVQLKQGVMTFKFHVQTEGGDDVMVRFYPESRRSVVHQEPDLLDSCTRAGLSVPIPIGDSRTGPPAPLNYVVYRRIRGETLACKLRTFDAARCRVAAEDLGIHLLRIQEVRLKGAGELITSKAGKDPSWQSFVERSMNQGVKAIKTHKLLEESLITKTEQILSCTTLTPPHTLSRLVWGDINFGNILVGDDGRITGLIDFESCLSGDPLATLGYAAAAHGNAQFFSELLRLWPNLLSDREKNLIDWYTLLRSLRLACYAHQPLPTGHTRDPLIQILPGLVPALLRLAEKC